MGWLNDKILIKVPRHELENPNCKALAPATCNVLIFNRYRKKRQKDTGIYLCFVYWLKNIKLERKDNRLQITSEDILPANPQQQLNATFHMNDWSLYYNRNLRSNRYRKPVGILTPKANTKSLQPATATATITTQTTTKKQL